ncbi:SRPBCC domain-containing protein [Streptosporangium lutulentum]
MTTDLGGFVSTGTVTAWDPPNRFAYRSDGPGERFVAFEYLIEGRDQSSAALRLVTSGFLPDDDWEAEFEAMTIGGQMYFQTLVAYLDHFAGRFATPVDVMGPPVADWSAAWAALRAALGLGDRLGGRRPGTPDGAGRSPPRRAGRLRQLPSSGYPNRGRSVPVHPRLFRELLHRPSPFSEIDENQAGQAWKTWLSALT